MLKELVSIQGVSGYEEKVSQFIMSQIKDYVDHIEVDAIGNLVALKRGTGENKKRIMCATHMDEIGLQIVKFTSEGFAKVRTLGGVSPITSYMNRVQFENGVMGVVANYNEIDKLDARDFKKVYIDFGLNKKEDVEKLVKIGDVATFVGNYQELTDHRVMSKALDDRAGCYILIEGIKAMETPYHDVYFTFTVQEEVGLRGATVAAEYIKPHLGIAIDITGSFDVPGDMDGNAIIGGGAAIKVTDASVICDRILVNEMVLCAKENSINYQLDVMSGGGTDAGAINCSTTGVKALGISIPTRYGHSPHSIVSKQDLQDCVDLLAVFLIRALNI